MKKHTREAANHFAEQVEKMMLEKRMTRKQLAAKCGVPEPVIYRILGGKENFSILEAIKIADALGCTINPSIKPL
jgi:predicted transcriptional regulator